MILKDENEILRSIIYKYYHSPKTKVVKIPKGKKLVSKIVTEEIPKEKIEYIDKGPTIYSKLVWGLAILIMLFTPFFELMLGLVIVSALVLLGILLFQKSRKLEKKVHFYSEFIEKEIIEEIKIDEKTIEEKIPNTDKIIVLKKRYIPFEIVNVENTDKFLLTGPKEIFKTTSAKFPTINHYEKYYKIHENMKKLANNVPLILSGDKKSYKSKNRSSYGEEIILRGFEKNIQENLISLSSIFQDIIEIKINIPIVNFSVFSPHLQNLKDRLNLDSAEVGLLKDYLLSREGIELEESVRNWLVEWDRNMHILHKTRFNSLVDKVSNLFFDLGDVLNYTAFNFYCPKCNLSKAESILQRDYSVQSDEIAEPIYFPQNTRCNYNSETGLWKCKSCENEFEKPIPMHKCYDEILMQAYDKLMDENKNERLKAHNETRNKEVKYMNDMEADVEKLSYDNLSLIYSLTDEMEKMKADIQGENEAINSLNEVSRQYQIKQNSVIKNINDYCKNMDRAIAELTKNVLAKVDNLKNTEMSKLDEELTHLSKAKRKDDEARDMVQKHILATNIAHMEISRQGFDKLDNRLQETNEIARDGFNRLDEGIKEGNSIAQEGNFIMKEGNEIAKSGFDKVTSAVDKGSQSITEKIENGNAIQAAMAKKQGFNLHDEAFFRLDKKIPKMFISAGSTLMGKNSIQTEKEKLNV